MQIMRRVVGMEKCMLLPQYEWAPAMVSQKTAEPSTKGQLPLLLLLPPKPQSRYRRTICHTPGIIASSFINQLFLGQANILD